MGGGHGAGPNEFPDCVRHAATSSQGIRCASCLRSYCPVCVTPRDVFFTCRDCLPPKTAATRSRMPPPPPDVGGDGAPKPRVADDGAEPQGSAASNIARFVAFLADAFAVVSASAFLGAVFDSDGGNAAIWRLLAITLIYEALFIQEGGQTLGKALANIHVVSSGGEPSTAVHAWMRALFKTGQFACCGLTLAATLFTRDRRGLHDMIAGTRVVKKVSGDGVRP